MREIREATYDEFVEWYFRREVLKAAERSGMKRSEEFEALSSTVEHRRYVMRQRHPGKLRPWFEAGRWRIVEVQSIDELEPLMIVAKATWEGIQGTMPRFLGAASRHLRRQNYFSVFPNDGDQLRLYYRRFTTGGFELAGEDRVVIVTLEASREWPPGSLYVHDGCGRLLAYLSYLREAAVPFHPLKHSTLRKHRIQHNSRRRIYITNGLLQRNRHANRTNTSSELGISGLHFEWA